MTIKSTGFRIEVPATYFAKSAARDYSGAVGMALVREFAQNAADAGATKVEFTFCAGNRLIVTDNGGGCDARTVRDVLLTPLASAKNTPDAVGGFGKAKELLFFANEEWSIITRAVRACGSYLNVETFVADADPVRGFTANVVLPEALWRSARDEARGFCAASEREGVEWVVNGEVIKTQVLRPARAEKVFSAAKAYLDRSSPDSVVYLRTGGLLTGTRWAQHGRGLGRVIIEVTKPSVEVLTPSRDWFRDDTVRREVESWLSLLATNQRAALAEEFGDEILFHDFEEVGEVDGAALAQDALPMSNGVQASVRFSGQARAQVAHRTSEMLDLPTASGVVEALAALKHTAPKAPKGFHLGLMPSVVGLRRIVAHTGGREQAKVAARWLKKNPEAAQRFLAGFATACAVVCARTGVPFDAVGFTFSDAVEAEFLRSKGRHAFAVNPLRLDLRDEYLADELLDLALHEVAHHAHHGHDEAFVGREATLRRACRGGLLRGAIARALRTGKVEQEGV